MKYRKGFTLIELMITVAIIGVLAAIAVMQYQTHVIRSQIVSAVAELNGARPQYELIVNAASSSGSAVYSVSNMFFSATSEYCTYQVYSPVQLNAVPALECQLKKGPTSLLGQSVFLNRSADGVWSCSTSSGISDKFKPRDCI